MGTPLPAWPSVTTLEQHYAALRQVRMARCLLQARGEARGEGRRRMMVGEGKVMMVDVGEMGDNGGREGDEEESRKVGKCR